MLGHRAGVLNQQLLGYREARHKIYLPAYRWVLDHCLQTELQMLREKAATELVVLLDYETNCDVNDTRSPLSHASLIAKYIENEWREQHNHCRSTGRRFMMAVTLTPKLKKEYEDLFAACVIRPEKQASTDALQFDNLTGVKNWNLAMILFKLEGFNGFGYRTRHPEVLTPYLWSFSNHYTKGKFVADGKFDSNAVSGQCGAAVIFKQMISAKIIGIPI